MVAELLEPRTLEAPSSADKVPLRLFEQATRLFEDGQIEAALAACDLVIELVPGIPEAHNNRGVALNRLGRHEEAVAAFDRAIALNLKYAEATYNRGVALGRLQRYQEAAESFERAGELRPEFWEAHANRSLALKALGRLDEAYAAVDQALALAPTDERAKQFKNEIVEAILRRLARRGLISWSGGKPSFPKDRVELTPGPPISQWIIESRR